MLPRDYDIALKAVENKNKYGYPKVLSVQNTKNARERAYKVQKLLADNGLSKGVTLAMQSVDSHTLKEIKRDNISIEDYQELQKDLQKMALQHTQSLFWVYQATHTIVLQMEFPM